ncbi:integral peroxisomal membrane peroxin-domain-containing protein [Lipomyces arxii]|uniref:integral peroxisomal membrane peroxin-domain-containing protein n=1 Tax=Lipomyces arxii TaxID=56418 RepID=UPI0034CE7AE0
MAALETPWLMSMSSPVANAVAPTSSAAAAASGSATTAVQSSPTYATFVSPDASHVHQTSPLLAQTPPAVTKALSLSYPYILAADRVVSLLTWTSNDVWSSFLVVAAWTFIVLHWEILIKYGGHLLMVGGLATYVFVHTAVDKDQTEHPTLDAIIHTLTTLTTRLDMFFSPLTSLSITTRDLTRLLLTTLCLSPIYLILSFTILTPRIILLLGGMLVLTYHSLPARVTRTILWRSRTVRLATFYLTGIDFSRQNRSVSQAHVLPPTASPISTPSDEADTEHAYTSTLAGDLSRSIRNRPLDAHIQHSHSEPVRFTYVIYENQRKWLGIGWTANLLTYERTAWTDEFLNECLSPDEFTLPDAEGTGMRWKWVDVQWRVDEANGDSDGWLYYDNSWKKPTKEDSFGRYTRRRRWVRNAELAEDEELLATETEVISHPVELEIEDYKPEIEKKDDSSSVKTSSSNHQSDSESITTPEENTGTGSSLSSATNTWNELKRRTLLRQHRRTESGHTEPESPTSPTEAPSVE